MFLLSIAFGLLTAFLTTIDPDFNCLYVSWFGINPHLFNLSIISSSTCVGSSRLSSGVFIKYKSLFSTSLFSSVPSSFELT